MRRHKLEKESKISDMKFSLYLIKLDALSFNMIDWVIFFFPLRLSIIPEEDNMKATVLPESNFGKQELLINNNKDKYNSGEGWGDLCIGSV